jgi:alkylation response protein AidB-like acyl-CoA dehydrogenase
MILSSISDMARAIESSWAWLENLTYQMVVMPESFQGERLGGPLALLKLQSTRTLEYCAREAQQILGGIGVTKGGQGARIEKISRSLRASAVAGGSEEVMAEFGVRQSMKVAANLGVKL